MSGPVERISSGQFFLLVMISVVAGGVSLWPAYVLATAGLNAIYANAAITATALGLTLLETHWALGIGRGPFARTLQETWGQLGAWALLPVNCLLCLALDGILLALYADMLQTFFYPFTPRLAMAVVMVVTAVWIAVRPLSVVARNVQFWLPLILLSFALVVAMALGNTSYWTAFRPSLPCNLPKTGEAALGTWFLYANGGVTASLVPFVRFRHTPRPGLVAGAAIVLQGAILLLLLGIVVATLGPMASSTLTWPVIYVFSLITVRTFFLKGVGVFVLIIWTTAMVLFLTVHLFCLSWNVEALAGGRRSIYTAAAGAVIAAVCVALSSVTEAEVVLFRWMNPLDLGWAVLTVPASFLAARVRERRRTAS